MENEPQGVNEIQDNEVAEAQPAERRGSRLPLILTIVSLLVWFGFQTVELLVERNNLSSLKGNLEAASQEAEKVRGQLQALITKTTELANEGNASARMAVAELEKRGIPIAPGGAPSK
jgi:hypothetical protein